MSDQPPGAGDSRSWFTRVMDLFSGEPEDRGDILATLRAATDRGILGVDELNILAGALHVAEMQARDVMIPSARVIALRLDQTASEWLAIILECRHSRLPVVGDGIDDIKGILHAKDLLGVDLSEHAGFDVKDCIRPAKVIPESKRLNVLLQEFRANRNHMAVVVDEYGSTAGVVTIEDVLEQIVGDIADEHDEPENEQIQQIDARSFSVKAVTAVHEFNTRFGCHFPTADFDTIGGIVVAEFGRLPDRDEEVSIDGFNFRVLSADGRRIRLLLVTAPRDIT